MEYRTVFDLTSAGYSTWWFPAFGLVFVLIGVILVRFRHALPTRNPIVMRRAFPWFFLGFAVIWTLGALTGTYGEYRGLSGAIRSGNVQIVEGKVSEFVPMPYGGHSDERFCVARQCFAYSDYGVTSGFNNTASHGGPIREGLPVRITHVGGKIVRLEIGQP